MSHQVTRQPPPLTLLGACLGTRLYRCKQIVVKRKKTANLGWYPCIVADRFVHVTGTVEKSTE